MISTRVSGATDLIVDGENGLLTDVGDTQQLINCITRMLNDPELRINCAQNAIDVSQKLNIDKIMDQWIKCIDEQSV